MDEMVSANVGDVLSVAELDIALLRQRGFVASYIMDKGNKKWIDALDMLEPAFRQSLDSVERATGTEEDLAMIRKVRETFERYVAKRREVISMYDRGEEAAAMRAYLGELDVAYFAAISACDAVLDVNRREIIRALADERHEIRRLTALMAGSGLVVALLGLALIWQLLAQVFIPLKRMAKDIGAVSGGAEPYTGDELTSLQFHMRALLEEISRSRFDRRDREADGQVDRLAAVGNAVASIAHEIRNRLTLIGGFARTIERRPDDTGRVRSAASIILQSSSRIERMLTDVLEFSKPRHAPLCEHSLNDLVRETVDHLAEGVPSNVALSVELDPSTPSVIMDPDAVEQVIINLVRNSIEAVEAGGKVKVSTKPVSGGAVFVVEDDGPGIPDEIREKMFEPFFTTKKTGSGLGLSITRKIVYEHGGEISFSSQPNRGTVVTVILRNQRPTRPSRESREAGG
jgi:signal transduction histidine kinase